MRPLPRSVRSRLLAGLLATAPLGAGAAPPPAPASAATPEAPARPAEAAPLTERLDAVERQLALAEEAVRAVEAEHSRRPEESAAEARARRFSDGEVLYLLGHHAAASVLLYDLVSDPAFREGPQVDEALYYLADALYQQDNLIGARVYLRELLSRDTPRFREVLARYLETAARLDQPHDVDAYVERARRRTGTLPPEVAYAWGKSLFLRRDLPLSERLARARALFGPLAADAQSPVQLPSAYFLGVCHVKAGELEQAAQQFRATAALPVRGERDAQVRELAHLSLARVLHELGRHAEAVDRYQEVARHSPVFPDALYETAWAYVRQGEHARAKATTDLLLEVAPLSPLAPEARLLQGHLLLRLKRYGEAADAYAGVINTFAPVRDELDATLAQGQEPLAYFDALLTRHASDLDASELLPEGMRHYARLRPIVRDGVRMVADLEAARKELAEARRIAAHVHEVLSRRGREAFPDLQEGYQRADAAEGALTAAAQALVELEAAAAGALLGAGEQQRLAELRRERQALQARLAPLPTTAREVDARRVRLQARVDAVGSDVLALGDAVQALSAGVAALERWVVDTRSERAPEPRAERELLARLEGEVETLTQLERELARVRAALADERSRAGHVVGAEERLREQLLAHVAEEHRLLEGAGARGDAGVRELLGRAREAHARVAALRGRVAEAKAELRARVQARGERLRAQVGSEVRLLEVQERELQALTGQTRSAVGRIAFDAFRDARQQFFELVQRADVGLVDVAFTRKADHTAEIQRVATQKDRDLGQLDAEFREVLAGEDG